MDKKKQKEIEDTGYLLGEGDNEFILFPKRKYRIELALVLAGFHWGIGIDDITFGTSYFASDFLEKEYTYVSEFLFKEEKENTIEVWVVSKNAKE